MAGGGSSELRRLAQLVWEMGVNLRALRQRVEKLEAAVDSDGDQPPPRAARRSRSRSK